MGGEVGQADLGERVIHDTMAAIPQQRTGEPARAVQLGGLVPVVDDQDEAAGEPGGDRVQPRSELEADLGDLALGELAQLDAVVRQTAGQLRGRRLGRELGESIAPDDEQLQQLAAADDDAVDRQGVEELVGKDDAGDGHGPDRWRAGSRQEPTKAGLFKAVSQVGQPVRVRLDRFVSDRLEEIVGPWRRRPSRMESPRVPDPAPYSIRPKGLGRSRPAHISSIRRAMVRPKMGCVSGAVRKSPASVGRSARWR